MADKLQARGAEAETRLARGEGDPWLFNEAAWAQLERGERDRAMATLEAGLRLHPGEPQTLTTLAALHRQAGSLRDAVLHCDAAIRTAPGYADAWLERGYVFTAGGSMARARECYDRVLALEPGHPAAHARLAALEARDGNRHAARHHAQSALRGDPGNAAATLALAAVELEAGEAEAARVRLAALTDRLDRPDGDRSLAFTLLGDAHARLGAADAAFAAYAQANADFAAIHAAHFAGRPPHRAFVTRIADSLAAHEFPPDAGPPPADAAAAHVFLLGYPRSGNTLVENVLASLPGVVAIEERPTLRESDQAYLADPEGLARLAGAGAGELARYRAAYWDNVAAAGFDARGRTLVDMDPLKGTRLPLIARLFPDARIVVMCRDPRDVVWSCFKTNFALTNAALDFTTLEETARHYAALMTLIERARERLDLAFHAVRYEALVADFDATTRELCAFLGLPWRAEMRRFDRTALTRGVATASAGQVRRGLFDGSGQWRPFAAYLAPVEPILAPWIERFGYG